ncbi:MAG: hypothetical protein GX333_02385 [Syntrophomonadaceae bacterium]|nr:hypothetical protein [Syntrophomonadaceae bacterium]
MENRAVVAKLKEVATGGKISCTEARQLATDFKVKNAEVGKLCNENDIKIYGCELGCF